jgi:hypothetical protein
MTTPDTAILGGKRLVAESVRSLRVNLTGVCSETNPATQLGTILIPLTRDFGSPLQAYVDVHASRDCALRAKRGDSFLGRT